MWMTLILLTHSCCFVYLRTNWNSSIMATAKEALAIVLDVGPSMVNSSSCLRESLQVINMILQRKIFSESKDEVMLILFGTASHKKESVKAEEYSHIAIERYLAPVTFDLIEFVQNFDMSIKSVAADFVDALVVAMDELKKSTDGKKTFGSKRIALFSNLKESFSVDQLDDIIASLEESCFEFNYIGPCLEDDTVEKEGVLSLQATNGELRNLSDKKQLKSIDVLKQLLDQTSGEYFSLSELMPCLSFINSRSIRSAPWKINLKIGTSLDIPVCLYTRLKEMKLRSFKTIFANHVDAEIERSKSFYLNDENFTEVDKADVIDGHRYGRTLVPFSADDKEAMKIKSEKCFKVLGFTKADNVKRYHYSGDSVWICLAEKGNEFSQLALSALINALYEANMVAIVRRVYSNGGVVKIGGLFPHIKATYECLFYVELPFAEDLHQLAFRSLPLSNNGDKFSPSEDQLSIINKLIDAMDLSGFKKEDDDGSNELFKPKHLLNPYLQHLYQCLEHRALHPCSSLPGLKPIISASLQTPKNVLDSSRLLFGKLCEIFKLSSTESMSERNKDGNNLSCNIAKDASVGVLKLEHGNNLEINLQKTISEVDPRSSLDDFITNIRQNKDDLQNVGTLIHKKITHFVTECSFQRNLKVLECIWIYRDLSVKKKACAKYNRFLLDLKSSLQTNDRNLLLQELYQKNAGLISNVECTESEVSPESAKEFFSDMK